MIAQFINKKRRLNSFLLLTALVIISLYFLQSKKCRYLPTTIPVRKREDLPQYLNQLGYKTGIELGVQAGHFAHHNLQNWPNCEKYYLVDIWQHQENYHDIANVENQQQDALYKETLERVSEFKEKIRVLRYKLYIY